MIKKLISLFTETGHSFQGQEPGEQVILILRKHIFTVSFPLSFIFLLALIPFIIYTLFAFDIAAYQLESLFKFASALWFMFLWLVSFYILTLYCLNTVVITNRRIIESEQHALFHRKVSELHIYRIQDVSVRTHGLIETFLSFGDLAVQTAASEREFVFDSVPHPERVKDAIMKTVTTHRSNLNLN
jgi:uncharacterized membrane protein YdbT with pleckstrin-like domain